MNYVELFLAIPFAKVQQKFKNFIIKKWLRLFFFLFLCFDIQNDFFMGFGDLLSKIFGNKADRDMREIRPYVDKINEVYSSLVNLTNDELRARTQTIREKIKQYVANEEAQVANLRAEVENQEVEQREITYAKIDELDKQIIEK